LKTPPPPHALGIVIVHVSTPYAFGFPVQGNPLALRIPKKLPVVLVWIFSGITHCGNYSKLLSEFYFVCHYAATQLNCNISNLLLTLVPY